MVNRRKKSGHARAQTHNNVASKHTDCCYGWNKRERPTDGAASPLDERRLSAVNDTHTIADAPRKDPKEKVIYPLYLLLGTSKR